MIISVRVMTYFSSKSYTIWPNICGHPNITKNIWTCNICWTSHLKFLEPGCRGFDPSQQEKYLWGQTLMLGDKVWLTVDVPIQPRGVGWGWRQSSVQASQVLPPHTRKIISLWTWLCAQGHCHDETGKSLPPQTVATNQKAHYCLKHQCRL